MVGRLALLVMVAAVACQTTVPPSRSPASESNPPESGAPSATARPSSTPRPPEASWQLLTGPREATFVDVTPAGSSVVALARTPHGSQVYSTDDGLTWNSAPDSPALDDVWLDRIAGGGVHFVAIGCRAPRGRCESSGAWTGSDVGTTPWQATGVSAFTGATLQTVAWASTGFLVVGTRAGKPVALRSDDGLSWEPVALPDEATLILAVAGAGADGYLVVGATANGLVAYTSRDAATWSASPLGDDPPPSDGVLSAVRLDNTWYVIGRVSIDTSPGESRTDAAAWIAKDGEGWEKRSVQWGDHVGTADRAYVVGDEIWTMGSTCSTCWPNVYAFDGEAWRQEAQPEPEFQAISPMAFAEVGGDVLALGKRTAIQSARTILEPKPVAVDEPRAGTLFPNTAYVSPRAGMPAAAAGGPNQDIFVLWPGQAAGALQLERFVPSDRDGAGSWRRGADVPVALSDPVIAYGGDRKLYLTGVAANGRSAPIYAYDVDQDRWSLRSNLPLARARPALAAHDGRLYVLGGRLLAASGSLAAGEQTPRVDVLTLATGRWTAAAAMPGTAERFAAVALHTGNVVVGVRAAVPACPLCRIPGATETSSILAGGPLVANTSTALVSKAQIVLLLPGRAWHYDVATNTWSHGAQTLRQGMSGPAIIGPTNDIFVFGCDRVDTYDPTLKVWHVHILLDQARCDPVVAIPDPGGQVIGIGGEHNGVVQAPLLALEVGGG